MDSSTCRKANKQAGGFNLKHSIAVAPGNVYSELVHEQSKSVI